MSVMNSRRRIGAPASRRSRTPADDDNTIDAGRDGRKTWPTRRWHRAPITAPGPPRWVRVAISDYPSSKRGHPPPANREDVMKAIHWIIAAAALAFVQPVQAATTDPEVIIYRFPGVFDDGSATGLGTATVFHCTNVSGVNETIRFVTRGASGALITNVTADISHLQTLSVGTHFVSSYFLNASLATGLVGEGTTAIAATSVNVI